MKRIFRGGGEGVAGGGRGGGGAEIGAMTRVNPRSTPPPQSLPLPPDIIKSRPYKVEQLRPAKDPFEHHGELRAFAADKAQPKISKQPIGGLEQIKNLSERLHAIRVAQNATSAKAASPTHAGGKRRTKRRSRVLRSRVGGKRCRASRTKSRRSKSRRRR